MSRCRGCDEWGAEGHWGPCANIEAAHPQPAKRPMTTAERVEFQKVNQDARGVRTLAEDLGFDLTLVPWLED